MIISHKKIAENTFKREFDLIYDKSSLKAVSFIKLV